MQIVIFCGEILKLHRVWGSAMLTSIAGKTVIVTGASKGIGRGIAKRFGVAGVNVLVVSRHLDEAEKVAIEIGANASSFAADVSEAEPCQAMSAAALERY